MIKIEVFDSGNKDGKKLSHDYSMNISTITLPASVCIVYFKTFSDALLQRVLNDDSKYKFADDETREKFKQHYQEMLSETLLSLDNVKEKQVVKVKKPIVKKKPHLPIPFYGHIVEGWCYGIKKNLGLYTQCPKAPDKDSFYCKTCSKQANNCSSGTPNCGDIRTRRDDWIKGEKLSYKPNGMTKEIPYANVMKKLNITIDEANQEVAKLGWESIPECHLIEKKIRRGRPAKTKVVVSDTDEDTPKKKRGRPKKEKEKELSDEELISALCGE